MYFNEFVYSDNIGGEDCRSRCYDSVCESYVVKQGDKLILHAAWDWDNGLYTESGYEDIPIKWKDLIYNLKNSRKKHNWTQIFNGKCKRCNKKLNDTNFKLEINFSNMCFEYDFYYCNECKQKQVDDYVEFMEKSWKENENAKNIKK